MRAVQGASRSFRGRGALAGRGQGSSLSIESAVRTPAAAPNEPFAFEPDGPLGEALVAARDCGAGDFHWSATHGASIRHCGRRLPWDGPTISARDVEQELLGPSGVAGDERFRENAAVCAEGLLPDGWRARCSILKAGVHVSFAVRFFPVTPPSPLDLGVPLAARSAYGFQDGLFLVAGGRGSGRTTTAQSVLLEMLSARPSHVLRVVRSVDYDLPPGLGAVVTWKAGREVSTLLEGLRDAASLQPRIVLVDDLVTADECLAALELAESGVFVLAAVRADNVAIAYSRFINSGKEGEEPALVQRFADGLRGILSQRLLPRLDAPGLLLVPELLLGSPLVQAVLRSGRTNQLDGAIRSGKRQGMIVLDEILLDLAQKKALDFETARRAASNKQTFDIAARRAAGSSGFGPSPAATPAGATPPPSRPPTRPPTVM